MTKQEFLLNSLAKKSDEVSDACLNYKKGALTAHLLDFMTLVALCGQEDLMIEKSPNEAEEEMELFRAHVEESWDLYEQSQQKALD